MNCQNCGANISENDRFCPACGAVQAQLNKVYCQNCGTEVFPEDTFCPGCGCRVNVGGQPVNSGYSASPTSNYNQQPDVSQIPNYSQQPYDAAPKKNTTGVTVLIVVLAVIIAFGLGFLAWIIITDSDDGDMNTGSGYYSNTVATPEPMPTPTPPAPEFDWVSASSTRGYDTDSSSGQIVHYYPEYAVDGDITTAWTPNRNTDTVPIFTLHANSDQYVTGIRMTNGYCKSEKTYTRNRRITKARISYRGGDKEVEFGIDNYRTMLTVKLDEPVYTDYISITVLDSYYGDWKDIAISEIEVF